MSSRPRMKSVVVKWGLKKGTSVYNKSHTKRKNMVFQRQIWF